MVGDIGQAIASAFAVFILGVIAVTAAVTAFLILGVPWLWHLLKPWLHHITS